MGEDGRPEERRSEERRPDERRSEERRSEEIRGDDGRPEEMIKEGEEDTRGEESEYADPDFSLRTVIYIE